MLTRFEEIMSSQDKVPTNNLPKNLKEGRGETIWDKSLVGPHAKSSHLDFLRSDNIDDVKVIILGNDGWERVQ